MERKACYTINRKRSYFRIYWQRCAYDYPLDMASELKLQHDLTWQQLADQLLSHIIGDPQATAEDDNISHKDAKLEN